MSEIRRGLWAELVRLIRAIVEAIIIFVLAVLVVILRVVWFLLPALLRAACVVFALWSVGTVGVILFTVYGFEGAVLAGLSAALIVLAVLAVSLYSIDAVRRSRFAFWGVCLFLGASAWAVGFAVQSMSWDALAVLPAAFLALFNPLFTRGKRE